MRPISEINRPNAPSYISNPNQVPHRFHQLLPISLTCHTPMLLGALTSSWPAEKRVDDEKTWKIPEKHWPMAYIGRHTRPEASTSGFRDSPGPPPSVDALGYVPAHRQSERNDLQVWYFFVVFFWHSTPPSVRGDTKRILARWRRPVASREALNTLYWSVCRRRAGALAWASKRLGRRSIRSSSTIARST
jgi:hypothetical protein